MPTEPTAHHQPPAADPDKPAGYQPGYQPTLGRKLLMIGLCILGLIIVWTVYFMQSGKP